MNAYFFHTETNPGLPDVPCDLDHKSAGHEDGQNEIPDGYQRPTASPKFDPTDSGLALPSDDLLTRRTTDLRNALHALFKVQSLTEWKHGLVTLFIEIQWFTRFAHAQRFAALAQLGAALEKHIADLHHDLALTDSSTSRRLAHAVELMITMIQPHGVTQFADHQLRALVATGNASSCQEIIDELEIAGIKATSCVRYETALHLAAEQPFELVIVNLEEPFLSEGLKLCSTMRKLPNGNDLTVVAINAPSEQLANAMGTGCNDVVAGPTCPSELRLRAVTHAFRKILPTRRAA